MIIDTIGILAATTQPVVLGQAYLPWVAVLGQPVLLVFSVWFVHWLTLRRQITLSDRKQRQQVIARLCGLRNVVPQMYFSYGEAKARHAYNDALSMLSTASDPSAGISQRMFDELVSSYEGVGSVISEMRETQLALCETAGLALTVFPRTERLISLVRTINEFEVVNAKPPRKKGLTAKRLRQWCVAATKRLENDALTVYKQPIVKLIEYLRENQ